MRNSPIIVNKLTRVPDGLGGHTETFEEIKLYGKMIFQKDKQVVTRAYDLNTQIITNMYCLYLTTFYNKREELQKLKRGDKVKIDNINYKVFQIESHNNLFLVTLMEEFNNEN